MRPEVTEERVINPSHAFSPGDQTIGGVNTYTQNLGIQSRESGCISLVERDLLTSYGCPGKREESQHDVPAAERTECYRLFQVRRKGEIRRGSAKTNCHRETSISGIVPD